MPQHTPTKHTKEEPHETPSPTRLSARCPAPAELARLRRAHSDAGDFVVGESEVRNFYNCLGIESPGLTSAPAIGEHIAGLLAAELNLPSQQITLAKRAGLLHDIGKALDHEFEGTHVALGVEYARKYREKEDIIHAIQAHHGDVECKTLVACLVQAADAISAARPGARRENLENYIKRLEKLEEITGTYPGVEKSYAIQAGREVRVMVKPEQVSEDEMVILARELAKRIENELEYPGQIKVHVLRETKVVEYAK